jgi:phenylalanyl-tRNA synthetase beta chain
LQIVCGAPNVRQGLAVVVALPGTVLPGDVKIGKSKIRGRRIGSRHDLLGARTRD